MVYKCVYGVAPIYLSKLLIAKRSLPSLRVSEDTTLLHEPRREQQNYKNRRFEVAGPHEWNLLPRSLREISSIENFKSQLKTHFYNQY